MSSVKISYIVCTMLTEAMFFVAALLAPIYLTPGWYWWTAACIFLMLATGRGFTKRVNCWDGFGNVDS